MEFGIWILEFYKMNNEQLTSSGHIPVLLDEVIELLDPKPNQNFIDCTLGGGGHAEEILKRTSPQGILLGIDLDEKALAVAHEKLEKYKDRVILVHDNFSKLKQISHELTTLHQINGILFDLGLSSYLLQDRSSGFSFQIDGPLDMRFDKSNNLTANEILNNWPKQKIARILWEYGREKFAKTIAEKLVNIRKKQKI